MYILTAGSVFVFTKGVVETPEYLEYHLPPHLPFNKSGQMELNIVRIFFFSSLCLN